MSNDANPLPATLPEPTDARFSMRAMLMAMALVAALAATIGPLVRRLEPDTQIRLLTLWGLWLFTGFIWIGGMARRRAEAEKLAGRTLLRLPMFDENVINVTPARRRLDIALAIAASLFMMFPINLFVVAPGSTRSYFELMLTSGIQVVISVFWFGRAVAMLWWRKHVRLCEFGILWDQRLFRWDHLIDHQWVSSDAGVLVVRGLDQRGNEGTLRISIPLAHRAVAQTLVDAKASTPSVAGRNEDSTYVLRTILVVVLWVAGFMILSTYAPMTDNFRQAMLLGSLASFLVSMRWRSKTSLPGSPLVRLTVQHHWLRTLIAAAVASGLYYVGFHYGWMSGWVESSCGFGFGVFVVFVPAGMHTSRVDLCEKGIVKQGMYFWPWSAVRAKMCDRAGSGRLELRHGWQRTVATVPSEQRDAVEKVLNEKLGAISQ